MFQIDAPPARPRRRRHRPAPEAPLPEESLAAPEPDPGISDADIEHFIKVELEQLDDPDFFRKLFG